jgi:hypothetical protein
MIDIMINHKNPNIGWKLLRKHIFFNRKSHWNRNEMFLLLWFVDSKYHSVYTIGLFKQGYEVIYSCRKIVTCI